MRYPIALYRALRNCIGVSIADGPPTGAQGTRSAVLSSLLRLAATGGCIDVVSVATALQGRCLFRLSAGANPAADRWSPSKGKRVFAVVGYCASGMMFCLGFPMTNHHLFTGFDMGPVPIGLLMLYA